MILRGLWVGLAPAACAAALGACGESSLQSGATANPAFAFAKCMRAHGVPNFPDPTKRSGGDGFSVVGSPGSSAVTIDGIKVSGPAFKAAETACKSPSSGLSGPPITEAQAQGMITKTRCMREHGVPSFPDPVIRPDGHGVTINLGHGFNPETPAIRSAEKACARVGASIPHTPT